jgi:hypothetical protein
MFLFCSHGVKPAFHPAVERLWGKIPNVCYDLCEVICPSGKFSKTLSSPPAKNIWLVLSGKSNPKLRPSRAPPEGRFAIVTNVERGMRWTSWPHQTKAAQADGEVVWS